MIEGFKPGRYCFGSLLAMLLTFGLVGWYWQNNRPELLTFWPLNQSPSLFWPSLAIAVTALTGLITGVVGKRTLSDWFDSDTRTFFTVMGGCCLVILLLIHLALVAQIALLSCAILLLRLDLYALGLKERLSFALISLVAIAGLSLGGLAHWGAETHGFIPPVAPDAKGQEVASPQNKPGHPTSGHLPTVHPAEPKAAEPNAAKPKAAEPNIAEP